MNAFLHEALPRRMEGPWSWLEERQLLLARIDTLDAQLASARAQSLRNPQPRTASNSAG